MTIGERLKRLRTEKGLTQEEVGNILGITKAAIQKYENGSITNFRSDTIRKLCKLFGIALRISFLTMSRTIIAA